MANKEEKKKEEQYTVPVATKNDGKIIRDKDISLPRTEDFYYNDLVTNNYTKMTQENIFYLEDPPENEDWMGFTADKALLSVKASKDAFKISTPYILTNSVTGSNVVLDMSQDNVTWPNSNDVTAAVDSLKKRAAFDAYRVSQDNTTKDEKTWIKDAAELRLLFFNPPALPSFTTTSFSYKREEEEQFIFSKTFAEVKNKNYIYTKKPFPYAATQHRDSNGNRHVSFDMSSKLYEKQDYAYKDSDVLYFTTQAGGTPRQVILLDRRVNGGTIEQQVLLLNQDNSNAATVANGYKARDIFVEKIKEAQDIRIVFDTNTMYAQDASVYTQEYPLLYGEALGPIDRMANFVKSLKNSMFDEQWYASVGYNAYGLDKYKRAHGVVYVKLKNPEAGKAAKQGQEYVWWNLNKYIIQCLEKDAQSNVAANVGERFHVEYGPTQLKPYTYDYVNNHYVDAFWKDALSNDKKRLEAQRAVFKEHSDLLPNLDSANFEQLLYEWTVTLGDVTFFVPPESIRVISQTETQRTPLIRARGTVAKGTEKSRQYYEISVYFNEERGINGVAFEQATPNYDEKKKTGKKITYKMNGFRALLAEMKFVPVINRTFNEVFGVYAVCFEALNVATVPGFPKLLKATIQLSKFNYQVYMPEIPESGYMIDGIYFNPFSCCIDYDTLRYYYQKPIILGDLLDMKLHAGRSKETGADLSISVNSYEFYTKTIFSNRTALLPCHFDDSTIRVYIANENHLKEMDKLKKQMLQRTLDPGNRYDAEGAKNPTYVSSNYTPTDTELHMIKDASTFMDGVDIINLYQKAVVSIQDLAKNLNKPGQVGKFTVEKDGITVAETVDGKLQQVKYKCNSEVDTNTFMSKYFYTPMLNEIKTKAKDLKNTAGEELVSYVGIDKDNKLHIELNMGQYIASYKDFANSQQEASAYIADTNQSTIKPRDIFADHTIHLQLPGYNITRYYGFDLTKHDLSTSVMGAVIRDFAESTAGGTMDKAIDKNQGILFLNWCKTQALPVAEANERTSDLYDAIKLETIHTLKYDLVVGTELDDNTTAPADKNAIVTQFSASVGNTYAHTSVSGADGSAPQYMGGQDVHLSFTLETMSEEVAARFKTLPEVVAYFNRTYRHVLSTYPVKIDSDFTRMLGVTEVMIDNVVVDTVPQFPGLYRISVTATSVDRTLRNKEALKALDVKNQTLSLSRLLEYRQSVDIKNYEKLDAELCKAEIYPDLELPTCTELGELGFRYIRYKDKERNLNNFYVDPDFYFIYPAITFGRMLLESLQYTFATDMKEYDKSQFIVDTSGSTMEVDQKTNGIKPESGNAEAKRQKEDLATLKRKKAEDDPIYHLGGDKTKIFQIPFGSWNIGTQIKCSYLEPYYLQELEKWKDQNMESRYRIMVDGKTEEQIQAEEKKVSAEYAWIERYSKKEKASKGLVRSSNFKTEYDKIAPQVIGFEKAASTFKQWLKTTSISEKMLYTSAQFQTEINEDLMNEAHTRYADEETKAAVKEASDDAKSKKAYDEMKTTIAQYLKESSIEKFLKEAYLVSDANNNSSFYDEVATIIISAADAYSSKSECNASNKDSGNWMAQVNLAKDLKEFDVSSLAERSRFGPFGIRRYTEAEILSILPTAEVTDFKLAIKDYSPAERTTLAEWFLLDPYYRIISKEKQKQYLENCAKNYRFAAVAFTRLVLWYLATLVELHIYPSIEYDAKRQECINMANASIKTRESIYRASTKERKEDLKKISDKIFNSQKDANEKIDTALQGTQNGQSLSVLMDGMKRFVQNNGKPLDRGKFLTASILAMLGEPFRPGTLFDTIRNRQYDQLNGLAASLVSAKYQKRNDADPTYSNRAPLMRKYFLALYGHGILDSIDNLGESKDISPDAQYLHDFNTKMALLAARNPARYMRDSFYDMVRNDYRGRMLRAFPTFYMIFIDEGREIGLFKLHDNFYNINAITEIQVVKSRVIAADTCKITMSNMFQTFTTNDESCIVNYKGGLGDLWESFWNPKASAVRAEQLRLMAQKIKLQAGIRIHVRMGYGANAKDLPVVFNGVIAEIQGNELVTVVAQGDGVELCNPLYEEADADTIKNNDVRFTTDSCICGAPPKDILQSILTAKGGCIAAMLRGRYRGGTESQYSEEAARLLREQNERAARKYNNNGLFNPSEWNIMVKETGDTKWGTINRVLLKMYPDNPYGIYHFGDPEYRDIFSQGEPAQNLYEITNDQEKIDANKIKNDVDLSAYYKNANIADQTAKKTELTVDDYAYFGDAALDLNTEINGWLDDHSFSFNNKTKLPYISFKPFGKTVWEAMHICQAIAPDWMTGIRDFGFRSTIFLGKPHYYYAYDYKKSQYGDIWIEKRKPYQQWHLYNSSYDIIKNSIAASSDAIKTNAVGLYELEGSSSVQKSEPVWVDQDIYPEYQKSSIVNTYYYGKSYYVHGPFGRAVTVVGTTAGTGLGAFLSKSKIGAAAGAFIGKKVSDFANDCVAYITNVLGDKHMQPYLDENGAVSSHEKKVFKMTVSALKDSMRQMYQGFMIVLGDPSLKPQDRIIINDAYEDVEGMCEVREVIHQMGPNTGFTTTITPDLISAHDPRCEVLKQNSWVHYATHIALSLAGGLINTLWFIKADARGATFFKEALEFLKTSKAGTKLTEIATKGWDAAKNAAKGSSSFTKGVDLLKQVGEKAPSTKPLLDNITKILAKHPTLKPFGSTIVKAVTGQAAALVFIGLTSMNSFLYRVVRNTQVLTLFPMKKFGKIFAAGVDGSEGLLYGAATFKQSGAMEQFYARFFSGDQAKDAGMIEKFTSKALGILLDSDVLNEAAKYQRNTEFIRNALFNPYNLKEEQLQSFSRAQLDKTIYRAKTAYAASLLPRVITANEKDSRLAVRDAVRRQTCIENIQDWITNPNLKNLYYLPTDIELERLFRTNFLRLAQDEKIKKSSYGIDDPELQNYHYIDLQGRAVSVTALKRKEIHSKTKKETTVLDVPYLSEDAKLVLTELTKFILESLIKDSDDNEIRQTSKDTFIIISSALIVGSENYSYNAGNHFILEGTGKLKESGATSLRTLTNQYRDQIIQKLADKKVKIDPLFKIDSKIVGDDKVSITIHPVAPNGNNVHNLSEEPKQAISNYDGKNMTVVQDQVIFSKDERTEAASITAKGSPHKTFERLGSKDTFERATGATALLDWNKIQTNKKWRNLEEGTDIQYTPTGFEQASFSNIRREDGSHDLYERCHLIGLGLTEHPRSGENIITGTYQFFKEKEKYDKKILSLLDTQEQKYHGTVLYKVEPVYDGASLVAKAIKMEAVAYPSQDEKYKETDTQLSKAAGLPFNIVLYNVQDGIQISYASGKAIKK